MAKKQIAQGIRAPKVRAERKVLPFRRAVDDDAVTTYQAAAKAAQAPIASLAAARNVLAALELALEANHSDYSWAIANRELKAHDIVVIRFYEQRIAWLASEYDRVEAVIAELAVPAAIYRLADFKRVARAAARRTSAAILVRSGGAS